MGSIEISTVLWIVGALAAMIGSLITVLWTVAWGAIRDNQEKLSELADKLSSRVESMHARIEIERTERVAHHDEGLNRAFSNIREVQEVVNDLRETVAGFGTIYVTRQEHNTKPRGN